MRPAVKQWVAGVVKANALLFAGNVLEVGSQEVKGGSIREVINEAGPRFYCGVDKVGGPGVDVVDDVMGWPDQHDTSDQLRATLQHRKCRRRDGTGIDIAGVRRDQGFGQDLRRGVGLGKQVSNLRVQSIRISRVEAPGHRRRAGRDALRARSHLAQLWTDHHL